MWRTHASLTKAIRFSQPLIVQALKDQLEDFFAIGLFIELIPARKVLRAVGHLRPIVKDGDIDGNRCT